MTQSQLAHQAQAGDFLRYYKSPTNIHTLINAFVPSKIAFAPTADITTIVQFPDVSFYQGEIDFDELVKHTNAVILRAGQNVWEDEQFKRNYAEAKRVGMLIGIYWFYDDRASPGAQADKLREVLGDRKLDLEIYIDWENSYGGQFKGLGNVVAMMQRVESFHLPAKDVGLYTGYYFFRANSNPIANAGQYNYLKDKPLWEAWYTNNPANVLIPAPWTYLTHWQWGTPAVAWGQKSREIDMNFYNGTQEEFDAHYLGEPVNYKTNTDAKLWRNPDGTIQISTIREGTSVVGDAFTSREFVRLTSPAGYTKKIWLTPVNNPPPPPPPPPGPTKTHTIEVYTDGSIRIDGKPYP